jgi:hypothetical protein
MKVLLWLDDVRNPFIADWLMQYAPQFAYGEGTTVWVKNYNEFVEWIEANGLPHTIAFDHDLGFTNEYYIENDLPSPEPDKSGFDCAKWVVEYCLNNKVELPQWTVQSANPTGRDNINGLLNNYRKHSQ